jgi:putative secretion ATPase (PEP-CTERM system associated)
MYEVFYNFKAEPFRLSPDHKFCYEHKGYARARAYMYYAFKRAEGFVMITGRPGTGKTTLIGELVESLSKDKVFTANLVCTQLEADDLLKTVAYSFGIGSARVDKAELLQRLTILLHRWHREGRRALLIVDEAQDLSSSAMEELRLLTNIQIAGQPLLQIFLLGQPELRDLILSAEMEQVHQRIVAASHIEGLEVDETEAYVLHRLLVVGWVGDPAIDRAVFRLIHKFSEGVPRRINLICSRLFLLGSVEERHTIGVEDVRVVISELQAENLAAGTGFSREDFDVLSEPEWVQVPAAQRLHAVANEPLVANGEQGDGGGEPKKKDTPNITPFPVAARDSVTEHPHVSSAHFELAPEDDQDNDNLADTMASIATPGPVTSQATPPPPITGSHVAAPRSRWRGGVVLAVFVLVAIVLAYFLSSYFSSRNARLLQESEILSVEQPGPATVEPLPVEIGLLPTERMAMQADVSPAMSPDAKGEDTGELAPIVTDATLRKFVQADSFEQGVPSPLQDDQERELKAMESDGVSVEEVAGLVQEDVEALPGPEQTFMVRFAFDSDALLPDSTIALDEAVAVLREYPDAGASITGFTDNQGDERYNLTLSRKRAIAVEHYLVGAGIARERLRVEGRGVLTEPVINEAGAPGDPMEPYRIVQITLGHLPVP